MNLIPKIAEALNIGLDEPFEISTRDGYKICRFFVRGDGVAYLEKYNKDFNQWTQENTGEIGKIVVGAYFVRKLPFEPKKGDGFYTVSWNNDCMAVTRQTWRGYSEDYCRKYSGNCFRTEAEAEREKYNIYEKLTGKKLGEVAE